MENVFIVLDTNTFLHYVSLEQVDWTELFPDQNVVLIICPAVIRELNKHKDAPRTPKLRDRAADVLRKIDAWADSESPIALRKAVEVRFRVYDSRLDFAAHNLVRDIADDHLIAVLFDLQAEASHGSVVLLTKDTGLKLKAKANGFSVKSLPDSALLPSEVLPTEKKMRELETQVLELRNVRPKLRLAFPDGTDKYNLRFQRGGHLSKSDIAERMASLRSKHPKMVDRVKAGSSDLGPDYLRGILKVAAEFSVVNPEQTRHYNENLDRFFIEYEEYMRRLAAFQAWESRTAAINIVLLNDGSCPAEDVDIFMHFPDGFEMFDEEDYKEEPKAPNAPQKPRSLLEGGLSVGVSGYRDLYTADANRFRLPAGPSNVSGPKIKRTNSYDVNVGVRKAKHGIEEALKPMYLTFKPSAGARSFRIDYKIHAANLPSRVAGRLNVIA